MCYTAIPFSPATKFLLRLAVASALAGLVPVKGSWMHFYQSF